MKTKEKLIKLGEEVINNLKNKKNPKIDIPIRALSNVVFNNEKQILQIGDKISSRFFFNVAHARKFMQTMLVAEFCKRLIDEKVTTSIRDLYYSIKHTIGESKENTFDEENESNPIIEDIEVTLDLLREQLNLKANRKGYMVGEIVINDAGDEIDCSKLGTGGWGVPSDVEPEIIEFRKIKAEYVLFVEKAAVWERLNEDKFWKKHNCILVTGEGMPSRGISRLLNRLRYEKNLPLYCLTDADPWGLYIYSVIKHGSINLAYLSSKIGTPDSKFIGLSVQDVEKFGISKNVTIKLTELDRKRAKELLNYEWFKKPEWQKEINDMIKKDYKLELEALSSKGIRFITEKYLPEKIKNKDFLP